ncbi:MAG: hypothetical protein RLZZ550_570 [Verrucomicrobiota bacterium]|jgi:hypothetical protein
MKHLPIILLGAALAGTVSFGPHPKQVGITYPQSTFYEGTPIKTYKISQGERVITHLAGAVFLCTGPNCPIPEDPDSAAAKSRLLVVELGEIAYDFPLTAWLPFFQSGKISAKVPVAFSRDGKKVGTYPNGAEIPADHVTVDVAVCRAGLIPLGHLDPDVEYVVLQGAIEGIVHRIREANHQFELRAMRDRPLK